MKVHIIGHWLALNVPESYAAEDWRLNITAFGLRYCRRKISKLLLSSVLIFVYKAAYGSEIVICTYFFNSVVNN